MAFTGLDPDAITAVATGLDKQAGNLGAAVHAIDAAARQANSSWQGPDASRFATDWSTRYREQLVAAQTSLSDMATAARRNVQEQTTASNDLSGAVPIGGGGSGSSGGGGSGGGKDGGADGYLDDSKTDPEDTPLGEKGDPADGPYTYAGSDGHTVDPGAGINGVGATSHGNAGSGEDNGTYYAGVNGSAAAGVHGDASQSTSVGGVGITAHEQGLAGGQASGYAGASAGPDGLYAAAGGAAAVGIMGSATSTQSYGAGVSTTETATGLVGARADANAGGSLGPDGISANAGASAFAGGQGAVTGGVKTSVGSVAGTAGVSYGIGASAHEHATIGLNNVDIGGDIGLTLGLGGQLGGDIQFDPEADLESLADAVTSGGDFNPLNW